jgi:hypothetical protein
MTGRTNILGSNFGCGPAGAASVVDIFHCFHVELWIDSKKRIRTVGNMESTNEWQKSNWEKNRFLNSFRKKESFEDFNCRRINVSILVSVVRRLIQNIQPDSVNTAMREIVLLGTILFFFNQADGFCHGVNFRQKNLPSKFFRSVHAKITRTTQNTRSIVATNAVINMPSPLFANPVASVVSKLVVAVALFATLLRQNIQNIFSKSQSKAASKTESPVIEADWEKRGYGNSFSRTLEIWIFAIKFIFKYVSQILFVSSFVN